ncbi:venom phosphodiesterase 2-like [Lytechinus variegatus]|uniref:venom phosphodiesterase 2-like n=1 Tax=Lytechinus variegatus TaxID=7654 RepID=UPI001BB13B26|nr:venom phosphodiesterase 2-like [Lytechinus variegatus]
MDEKQDFSYSFSNAAYDSAEPQYPSFTKKSNTRTQTILIALVFILVISLGAGIGIGFAIGNSSGDKGGGSASPIVGVTTPKNPFTEPRKTEPQSESYTTKGNAQTEHTKAPPHHTDTHTTGPPHHTGTHTTGPPHQTDTPSSPPPDTPPPPQPYEDWIDMPCSDTGPKCPAGISSPPVLLISLDGFRADFLSRGITPVINRMAECGVKTPHMIPTFPTVTFPNHYTIVTGLYPESHGIVGNTMYDFGTTFSLGSDESFNNRWWGGEPIWNTARFQGKRSATFFWPGSDSDIQGIRPNYYNKYDGELNYIQRVDTVLGWLRLPDGYRPDVVTLYFDEPDHTGHDPGPNTDEQDEVVARMDGMMRRLMDGLMKMGMIDCVNIIAIADHGMSNRTCDQTFILNDYLPSSEYRVSSTAGTMLRMLPEDGATVSDPADVVEELLCKHPVAVPYVREDLPKRWHYINNRRIEPIEVTVPEQWTASGGSTSYCNGGTHGYDNLGNLMKAMFVAIGPGFKSGVEVQPFQNIELYNVMCELLDLDPAPNNGTMGSLHHMLRNPKPLPNDSVIPIPEMDCPFPSNDDEYNSRLQDDMSGCQCNSTSVEMYDKELNLTSIEEKEAMALHTPLGAPVITFDTDYCHLTQHDYVTAYSHDLRSPLWSSFTLRWPQPINEMPIKPDCRVRPDVRVDAEFSPSCSDFEGLTGGFMNLTTSYLFPPALSSNSERFMDSLISTNTVPQYPGFIEDILDGFLVPHLALWANISSEINVVTGPVFDFDGDGLRDNNNTLEKDGVIFGSSPSLLPSHYFMVVIRCKGGAQLNSACAEVESAAFVLRNNHGIKTCQTQPDYVEHNLVTIKDIENLTGLTFYPQLPRYDSIQLKLYAPNKGDLWSKWPLMSSIH